MASFFGTKEDVCPKPNKKKLNENINAEKCFIDF